MATPNQLGVRKILHRGGGHDGTAAHQPQCGTGSPRPPSVAVPETLEATSLQRWHSVCDEGGVRRATPRRLALGRRRKDHADLCDAHPPHSRSGENPWELKRLERAVADHVRKDCPQVKWVANYATLGPYDYPDIFEAPDETVAAKVVMIVRSYGHGQTET